MVIGVGWIEGWMDGVIVPVSRSLGLSGEMNQFQSVSESWPLTVNRCPAVKLLDFYSISGHSNVASVRDSLFSAGLEVQPQIRPDI